MTSREAITKVKELIKPINALSQMRHGNVEFQKWYRRVVLTLGHIYPSNKTHVKSFVSIKFTLGYYCFDQELRAQQAYVNGLESAKGFLEVLVEEIKEYGLDGCNGEQENEACMHSVVASVSEKAIRAGLYADAVERAFKAINSRIKKMVKGQVATGDDGVKLMQKVFSENNPLIRLASDDDPSGADVQRGYMHMFIGGMSAIRNPKAHDNIEIDKNDALRKLYFASMLMYKLDEAERNGWVIRMTKETSRKK